MMTQGSAIWSGGIKDGRGAISTKSGALAEYPYGFASRFEGKPGTNPEELIGAAHAHNPDKHPPLSNVLLTMIQKMGVEETKFSDATGTLTGLV